MKYVVVILTADGVVKHVIGPFPTHEDAWNWRGWHAAEFLLTDQLKIKSLEEPAKARET